MIIRIKPFGHLHRNHIFLLVLLAVGHGEIEAELIFLQTIVARRDGSESEGEVEGCVVVGEIVGRDEVDACLLQQVPVFSAEISGGILQFVTVDLTNPIGFASLLEFTLLTNARIAQHICLDVFDTTHISCFLCCYSFSAAKVRRRISSVKYSFVFRKTF